MKEDYIEKFAEAIRRCDNIEDIDYAYQILVQCINYSLQRDNLFDREVVNA